MEEELKKFIKKYCIKCKELCDKGITKGKGFIKCNDRGITHSFKERKKEK